MLSAIVITKNEEENIKFCLDSVKKVVEEIIVVDSWSNDRTTEVAGRYTDKIFYKKFRDDGAEQRNYAMRKAKGDWILALDADESLSSKLKNAIPKLINNPSYKGYLIPRRNYINKREWLKYGLFFPDYQLRLFKKRGVKFIHPLHTHPNVDERFVSKIKPYLIHNSSHTKYDSFISVKKLFSKRHNHIYIQAKYLLKQKKLFFFNLIFSCYLSIKYFMDGFIMGKGFLDGWKGFRAAIIFSIIPLLVVFYSQLISLGIIKKLPDN